MKNKKKIFTSLKWMRETKGVLYATRNYFRYLFECEMIYMYRMQVHYTLV